jgi:hypothetical protein
MAHLEFKSLSVKSFMEVIYFLQKNKFYFGSASLQKTETDLWPKTSLWSEPEWCSTARIFYIFLQSDKHELMESKKIMNIYQGEMFILQQHWGGPCIEFWYGLVEPGVSMRGTFDLKPGFYMRDESFVRPSDQLKGIFAELRKLLKRLERIDKADGTNASQL